MSDRDDRLAAARADFEKVRDGGVPRGREAFVTLLNVQSELHLRSPGNPVNYGPIGTDEQAFGRLLRNQYRLAARQNYEDSTDANFLPSGRPVTDALRDLHLAPAYMQSGGLDPARDADWQKNGVAPADFITVKAARLRDLAKRSFDQVRARTNDPVSNVIVLDEVQARLRHAQILTSRLDEWKVAQAAGETTPDLAPVIFEAVAREWNRGVAVDEKAYEALGMAAGEFEAFRRAEQLRADQHRQMRL